MSWAGFWLVAFAAAFAAWCLISLAIAVRGVAEIRQLFSALDEERKKR
jgi:hypothetical protein